MARSGKSGFVAMHAAMLAFPAKRSTLTRTEQPRMNNSDLKQAIQDYLEVRDATKERSEYAPIDEGRRIYDRQQSALDEIEVAILRMINSAIAKRENHHD